MFNERNRTVPALINRRRAWSNTFGGLGRIGDEDIFILGVSAFCQAVETYHLIGDLGRAVAGWTGQLDSGVGKGKNELLEVDSDRMKNNWRDYSRSTPVMRISHVASRQILADADLRTGRTDRSSAIRTLAASCPSRGLFRYGSAGPAFASKCRPHVSAVERLPPSWHLPTVRAADARLVNAREPVFSEL